MNSENCVDCVLAQVLDLMGSSFEAAEICCQAVFCLNDLTESEELMVLRLTEEAIENATN